MRYKMLGVGVVLLAAFAFSAMAVASSAMAEERVKDLCIKPLGANANTGLFMKRSSMLLCEVLLTEGGSEFELVEFLLSEYLVGGVGLTETLLVETTGELLLENSKAPIVGKAGVLCSSILVGDIGPDGADDATEVLNLEKEAISSTPLSGLSLTCTDVENCESSKAWPVGLPWLSLLELWETETAKIKGVNSGFANFSTSPTSAKKELGWYIECTVLGVKSSEECTTPTGVSSEMNMTAGVESEFSISFTESMGLKLAECSGNKEETGIVEGIGTVAPPSGETLTVSE
jgi:hypothetical protein